MKPDGTIAVAAGVQSGGPTGLAADGTPATGARFGGGLRGLAADAAGNL